MKNWSEGSGRLQRYTKSQGGIYIFSKQTIPLASTLSIWHFLLFGGALIGSNNDQAVFLKGGIWASSYQQFCKSWLVLSRLPAEITSGIKQSCSNGVGQKWGIVPFQACSIFFGGYGYIIVCWFQRTCVYCDMQPFMCHSEYVAKPQCTCHPCCSAEVPQQGNGLQQGLTLCHFQCIGLKSKRCTTFVQPNFWMGPNWCCLMIQEFSILKVPEFFRHGTLYWNVYQADVRVICNYTWTPKMSDSAILSALSFWKGQSSVLLLIKRN